MPEDKSRVTYDENGGKVTQIPKGTPKQEVARARAEGRVDKNDPAYTVEDAKKDAGVDEDGEATTSKKKEQEDEDTDKV